MSLNRRSIGISICSFLIAGMVVFVGCKKAPSYETFGSPDEAGDALLQAAKSGDQNQVLAVFGMRSSSSRLPCNKVFAAYMNFTARLTNMASLLRDFDI